MYPIKATIAVEELIRTSASRNTTVHAITNNAAVLDAIDLFDDNQRLYMVYDDGCHDRVQPAEGWTRSDWIRICKGRNLSAMWINRLIPFEKNKGLK
ncbi:MAG: hypothetical protein QM504_08045 [Pseudomonadota bacterium]